MSKHSLDGSTELRFYKITFLECIEESGYFSEGLTFWLVNMPLCERPAGQGVEKSYLALSHVVRVGKPARSIRTLKYRYELIKEYAIRTLTFFVYLNSSVLFAKIALLY